MNNEELYYYNQESKLTKVSTYTLIKICNQKVDEVNAEDPMTALIIFVYDSEYKHNIFQLCVYRDIETHKLLWRPFINNTLGDYISDDDDLFDFLGSYLLVEINDMNLDKSLMDLVAKQIITEDELKFIRNGGKKEKVDNNALKEFALEEMDKDPTVTVLPSILEGYGMPGSNPYINQFNESMLKGKGKTKVLNNEEFLERINTPGNLKQTKSGIYLLQN